MIGRSAFFICLVALGAVPAGAQEASTPGGGVHRDTLIASGDQPFQLRPIVLPGSERVLADGAQLDTSRYRIDYRYARLWIDEADTLETLVVEYRTLPFRLQDVYRRHEPADVDAVGELPESSDGTDAQRPLLAAPTGLQHSGSITRGILAGNRRDVTVESGLRMQVSGEIADGVNVQAMLTDENTPILPEGTTQRIEEFDRVFIGIDAPYGSAQLGDFDLSFQDSEFARFSRKLQGGSARAPLPPTGGFAGGEVTLAGATSRGTFREQVIEAIDGVQGPYRLEGTGGEQFVLVVPGSETVYVDGQALTRGESNDYTIDYATAELHFTPNVIVTDDLRIQVEFEYATSQFTRSLVGTDAGATFWPSSEGARARVGVSFIREADGSEFSEAFGFSRLDSLAIVRAGDGVASSDGAQRVEFNPEAPYVQYRREVHPGGDTIFVALDRAPSEGEAVYRVQFSRVGEGEGSYERVGRSVNGILYEYRGPGQGSYLPVRTLSKPKRQQLLDLRGSVRPVERVELFGEWARSVHDENRLSPLDAVDDLGDAFVGGVRLHPSTIGPGRVSGEYRRRFVAGSFASFNRIRPVEFERRWNLPVRPAGVATALSADETIDEGSVRLDFLERSNLQAEVGRITMGSVFEGLRRTGTVRVDEEGLPVVEYRLEAIKSSDSSAAETGRWVRQLGSVSYSVLGGRFTPRLEIEHENRRQEAAGADSLVRPSFRFVEVRPGLAWDGGDLEVGGYVERRTEDDWIDGSIRPASTSWTGRSTVRYRPFPQLDVDGSVGFRSRRFEERFRIEQNRKDVQSLLLRFNGGFRPLQRAVRINLLYEGMTERTPTLQEIYVRTGPEIGQYVWEDANDDGIVQIDELLPERLPNEGTYVKTFIPSDTLTSVVNVQSRLRLELDPRRWWPSPDTRWQRWLSEVSTRTVLEVREKSRDPNVTRVYLLDLRRFRDPVHTMNGRVRVAQDVFLFRGRPDYGLDVSFSRLRSLSELAAGSEERFVNTWRAEGTARPGGPWGLRAVAALEQDRLFSATFESRRYDISGVRLEPEASYAVSDRVQLVSSIAYGWKRDGVGQRRARLVKLPMELRYNVPRKLRATARFEVAEVDVQGTALGLARFELTDGRGPGRSYLWSLRGQYTVNEYLRATLSYDGRAPSDARVIHSMQVQLSALF
ncbi:MAG: hypothetical protein WD021_06175 [Rhodothermales bacterium]